ncbi:MAG: tetratricopeptide repeat protein [Candidatus Sericytochromatia bacterium]
MSAQMEPQRALAQAIELHQSGRLAEAEACYQRLLQAAPMLADAWHLSGVLACQQGNFAAAVSRISKAMALAPAVPQYVCNLAQVFAQQGDKPQAISACLAALRLDPDSLEARRHLASLYQAEGKSQLALAQYQAILARAPGDLEAHSNLAVIYQSLGDTDAAIACYRAVLERVPASAQVHYNLGTAYFQSGQVELAIRHYQASVRLDPRCVSAYNNLGNIYLDQNRPEQAVEAYLLALKWQPDHLNAILSLDLAWFRLGQISQMIASTLRALSLHPTNVRLVNNLGNAYRTQARLEPALAQFRRALELEPGLPASWANLLMTLNYLDLPPQSIFAEHRAWGEQTERRYPPANCHSNSPEPWRRLRIGYLSPVFKDNVGTYFIEAVLRRHDRLQFEVYCYSDLIAPDAVTRRLQGYADHWRELHALDVQAAAALIQRDQIDLLVDLNGHTHGNRLAICALKPAPVQLTYIGYANTTGLTAIDYRLTDAWADPPGLTEAWHTEELVRLPQGFQVYQPPEPCPEVSALPALERGHVTFGSFNLLAKLTPRVIALWARVLRAVPGSRLLLKSKALADAPTAADFRAQFAAQGIEAERLMLVGHAPDLEAHLAAYGQMDIALDPFPYNGTTTTCEALWMGVPVITLAGRTHVSRVGVSLLSRLGMEACIAEDEDQYVAIAARLAGDLPALKALRQELREQMGSSPLCDGPGFTRRLEATYRQLWQRWCNTVLPG